MNADELDSLTERVLGAVFEVTNTLGAGFLEKVYQRALLGELGLRGLRASAEASFTVTYKGHSVGEYFADLLVEDVLVVELKCVERLPSEHTAQCLNYPRASGLQPNRIYKSYPVDIAAFTTAEARPGGECHCHRLASGQPRRTGAAIAGVVFCIMILGGAFRATEFGTVVAQVLLAVFYLAAVFCGTGIALYRARTITTLPDSQYTVIPIVSTLLRLRR